MEPVETKIYKTMNINLDKRPLKNFKYGRLLDSLYNFDVRWYNPEDLKAPEFDLDRSEVARVKRAINDNRRLDPVVALADYGVVAGFHLLKAFKDLKYERIPVLYGKLKK